MLCIENILIDKSKKFGLTNEVKFLGRVNNERIPKLLNESHIYISFPTTEGLSASLLEAMACGCVTMSPRSPETEIVITSPTLAKVAPLLLFEDMSTVGNVGTVSSIVKLCRKKNLYLRDISGMGSSLEINAIRMAVKDANTNKQIRLRASSCI